MTDNGHFLAVLNYYKWVTVRSLVGLCQQSVQLILYRGLLDLLCGSAQANIQQVDNKGKSPLQENLFDEFTHRGLNSDNISSHIFLISQGHE